MAKKPTGKSHPNNVYKLYEKSGDSLKKKGKFCPKCGGGIFMAQHKDRSVCGKCSYTEFSKGSASTLRKEKRKIEEPNMDEVEELPVGDSI